MDCFTTTVHGRLALTIFLATIDLLLGSQPSCGTTGLQDVSQFENRIWETAKMDTHRITNETVWTTDFAHTEKTKFLQSQSRTSKTKSSKTIYVAPCISAQSVWMTDVSGSDRRSVKAQLAGRGDFRVAWWEFNCLLHRLFKPNATLEQMMYAFHSRHHRVTLNSLEIINEYWSIYTEIRRHGKVAGIKFAFRHLQELRKTK